MYNIFVSNFLDAFVQMKMLKIRGIIRNYPINIIINIISD